MPTLDEISRAIGRLEAELASSRHTRKAMYEKLDAMTVEFA